MESPAQLSPDTSTPILSTAGIPAFGLVGQIVRFGTVGAINTLIDLFVLNTLIFFVPSGRSGALYSVFKTCSFLVAVINSYLMNRTFTFRSEREGGSLQLTRYLAVSVVGLLINVGIATTVATHITPPAMLLPWWPSIAALVGIPFGLVWNFVGYRLLVF